MPDLPGRSEEGLVRAIGVGALATNAVNLTIGAGIFVLPSVMAAQLGPSAIFAYVVCALAIGLVMLCFAEAGSRVPRSGGVYAYVDEAFGPYPAFLVGTLFWFGFCVISDAAIAAALMSTLASVVPALGHPAARTAVLALLFTALAVVNILSVRHGTAVSVASTIAKLVPLLLLVAVGAVSVVPANLAGLGRVPPLEPLGAASLVLFYAFSGAESALNPSGEIRTPATTVPRALLLAVVALFALYAGLHLVAQGVMGAALAGEKDAPLAAVAAVLWGTPGRALLVAGATVAAFGALCGDVLGTPRILFGQARNGLLPAALATVHPTFRTPHVAIVAFAVVTFVAAATGAFERLAILSSVAILIVYLATCLAVLQLRRSAAPAAFRVWGGPLVPLAAIAVLLWLLSNASRAEAVAVATFFAAATMAYRFRPVRGRTASPQTHAAPDAADYLR